MPNMNITEKTRQAIESIIEYLYFDERRNYEENPAKDHIFHSIQTVEDWLHPEDKISTDFTYPENLKKYFKHSLGKIISNALEIESTQQSEKNYANLRGIISRANELDEFADIITDYQPSDKSYLTDGLEEREG